MKKQYIIVEIIKKSVPVGLRGSIDKIKLKEYGEYKTRFATLEEAEANIPKNYGYPVFTILTEYVNHILD